jgi:hypothetical protein
LRKPTWLRHGMRSHPKTPGTQLAHRMKEEDRTQKKAGRAKKKLVSVEAAEAQKKNKRWRGRESNPLLHAC